jgi:hypothetical protein
MKMKTRLLLLVARRKLRKLAHLAESAETFTGCGRQVLSQHCREYYALVREMDSTRDHIESLLHL